VQDKAGNNQVESDTGCGSAWF